jgi:hypothetical protein
MMSVVVVRQRKKVLFVAAFGFSDGITSVRTNLLSNWGRYLGARSSLSRNGLEELLGRL